MTVLKDNPNEKLIQSICYILILCDDDQYLIHVVTDFLIIFLYFFRNFMMAAILASIPLELDFISLSSFFSGAFCIGKKGHN